MWLLTRWDMDMTEAENSGQVLMLYKIMDQPITRVWVHVWIHPNIFELKVTNTSCIWQAGHGHECICHNKSQCDASKIMESFAAHSGCCSIQNTTTSGGCSRGISGSQNLNTKDKQINGHIIEYIKHMPNRLLLVILHTTPTAVTLKDFLISNVGDGPFNPFPPLQRSRPVPLWPTGGNGSFPLGAQSSYEGPRLWWGQDNPPQHQAPDLGHSLPPDSYWGGGDVVKAMLLYNK